jgi:hypothetical protein
MLEITASVIEDVKSRCAITTACQVSALSCSTMLVKGSSSTVNNVSVITVCFPSDLTGTPNWVHPQKRTGSSTQTSWVTATYHSVHFRSLLATQCHAGQPYLYTRFSGKVNGWETHMHAGRWHKGHSLNSVHLDLAILNHCAPQAQ